MNQEIKFKINKESENKKHAVQGQGEGESRKVDILYLEIVLTAFISASSHSCLHCLST